MQRPDLPAGAAGPTLSVAAEALLKRLSPDRYLPVRRDDYDTALALHMRVPCLVAMGPGDREKGAVVAITDAGRQVLAEAACRPAAHADGGGRG